MSAIGLVYTGGTIGMPPDLGEPLSAEAFMEGLARWPWASRHGDDVIITTESGQPGVPVRLVDEYDNAPIDSSGMEPRHWIELSRAIREAERSGKYRALLVLHGTDTMAWTSSALSFLLGRVNLPVLVTGAQRPLAENRTDAARNLLTGIGFAQLPNLPREVSLCFDNALLRGNRATKVSVGDFTGFDSPNFPPIGSAGVELRLDAPPVPGFRHVPAGDPNRAFAVSVAVHPGLNRAVLPSLPDDEGVRIGVLLELYGSGTASREALEPWLGACPMNDVVRFHYADHDRTLFPLHTTREIISGRPDLLEEHARKRRFSGVTTVYADKAGRHLRRTPKLGPVAEYALYGAVLRGQRQLIGHRDPSRMVFGYRFSHGERVPGTTSFKRYRGATERARSKYRHGLHVDVANYFNSVRLDDFMRWLESAVVDRKLVHELRHVFEHASGGGSVDFLPQGHYSGPQRC